jgi:DNA-binding NtrC family response regulator
MMRSRTVTPIAPIDQTPLKRTLPEDILLIGKSPSIQDIYKMIGLLTTNEVPVLIEGESGVGKELVARAIHYKSDRYSRPFVAINCGAMPDTLLETELFGHERGAFTGADGRKIGKFEHAADGTIFLDEIGDLPLALQVKLLRVLQEKNIVRLGGLEVIPARARVITATNKKLAEEMEAGNFRSDLYYRLQLITLKIPPLRERKEDIPDLSAYFIRKANTELGKSIRGIETAALDKMMTYDWPGNVRELENIIKRAIILTRGETLGIHRIELSNTDVVNGLREDARALVEKTVRRWFRLKNTTPFFADGTLHRNLISAVEKTLILESLAACDHNQVKASEVLGMNRATFRKKMEEYGLKTPKVI